MGLAFTFFIAKKVNKKSRSKKAIAWHRSLHGQNAFSIAYSGIFQCFCYFSIDALLTLRALLLVFDQVYLNHTAYINSF